MMGDGDSGGSRRRKLSEDEHALWGRVTRSVAPLKRRRRSLDREEADPRPEIVRPVSPASKPAPRPATLDRRLKQRLARGTEPIDASLDLHGRTQSEAHAALVRFLRNAQAEGARFVLVVTGKGGRADEVSGERGVLKRQVPLWLGLPELSPYVVGFEEAHLGDGGSGALYVRVRRRRSSPRLSSSGRS
jgi:DNA-nicking Smr family endonuclease